ncbi:MAG TPA: DUF4326 domain-containing protein [Planctomycetaceae bacterium]
MPIRRQRRRSKGWRMPPDAVYVGRPTLWGNPFPVGIQFRWTARGDVPMLLPITTPELAVAIYRAVLTCPHTPENYPADLWQRRVLNSLAELRGHDLACWCAPGKPCHADVLLELANR